MIIDDDRRWQQKHNQLWERMGRGLNNVLCVMLVSLYNLTFFQSSILLFFYFFLSYFSSQFKKPNLFWKILKLGELCCCCCCCCCVLSARRMGKTNKKCRRLSRSWVWVNRDQIFGRSRPPSCTSELWSSSKGVERNRPILTAQWWVVDGRRLLIFFSFFFFFFFFILSFAVLPPSPTKKKKKKKSINNDVVSFKNKKTNLTVSMDWDGLYFFYHVFYLWFYPVFFTHTITQTLKKQTRR